MTKACILRDPQASVYGKCIVADYNSVHKDKCLTEFLRLKDCYMVRSPKVLSPEITHQIADSSKKVLIVDNPLHISILCN
jgi:hypothetical protein